MDPYEQIKTLQQMYREEHEHNLKLIQENSTVRADAWTAALAQVSEATSAEIQSLRARIAELERENASLREDLDEVAPAQTDAAPADPTPT